jgi:hypothetical protein
LILSKGERAVSLLSGIEINKYSHVAAEYNWNFISHHTKKINLKWIEYLIRTKTIKLLEENPRGKLCDIGLDTDFLDMTPKP